jgi:hypothetical protein
VYKIAWYIGTYSSEKGWDSSQNRKNEEQRDYLWAALRISSEDVVYFLQFSVSQWLLVLRQRRIGVRFHVEVEDMVAECLGGAEGSEEEGSSEGLSG